MVMRVPQKTLKNKALLTSTLQLYTALHTPIHQNVFELSIYRVCMMKCLLNPQVYTQAHITVY